MRKPSILFFTPPNNNPTCPSPLSSDGRCAYEQDSPSLSSGHSYSFTKTDFIRCDCNQYGGAIYLNGESEQSATALEVSDSTFTTCYANEGAGIYVNAVSSLKVSSSLFYNCGNSATVRGGGICMKGVSSHEIKESLFLSLNTNEDAGAVFFDGCTQNLLSTTVKDNRFLHCECTGKSGSSGGVIELRDNTCPRFRNCLFSYCIAIEAGGALLLFGAYPSPVLSFSFFHDNTATSNNGHDCCLYDGGPADLALHCLSDTSRTPHVSPSNHDHWLPKCIVR